MDKKETKHESGNRGIARRYGAEGRRRRGRRGGLGFPAILKAADKVKLGFMTALTGLETILGETQLNCFKLAVEEINAAGARADARSNISSRTIRRPPRAPSTRRASSCSRTRSTPSSA